MKYLQIPLVILATLSTSLALADDFKTILGKEYKDATVTRVEPDGILVKYNSGISKLYFTELPKKVQERFHYDPQTATAYSAQQAAVYEADAKQQDESRHRQENADAQRNANIAKQQAANDRAQELQDRDLVKKQQKALQHARDAERSRSARTPKYTTVLHPLPVVRSQPSSQVHHSTKSKDK